MLASYRAHKTLEMGNKTEILPGTNAPAPEGDVSKAPIIIGLMVVLALLGIPAMIGRMYCRGFIVRKFGADDYFLIAAFILSVFGFGSICVQVQNGYGRHQFYLTEEQVTTSRFWGEMTQWANAVAVSVIKLSVSCFILRMLAGTHATFRRFIYVLMGFIIVITLGYVIIFWIQCNRPAAKWPFKVQDEPGTKCLNGWITAGAILVQSSFNVLSDLVLSLSPIWFLKSVQIRRRKKYILLTLMGMGILTTIASALRIAFLFQLFLSGVGSADATYSSWKFTLASLVEQGFGIFVAILPGLTPLLRRFDQPSYGGGATSDPKSPKSAAAWLTSPKRFGVSTEISGGARDLYHQDDLPPPTPPPKDYSRHNSWWGQTRFSRQSSHYGPPDVERSMRW